MTSASDLLRAERSAICDTFDAVGPDAPTLCEGWAAADVAAHLLVREHRPDALPGVVIGGPFARHTERLMEREKDKGYGAMIGALRAGPPFLFRAGPGALANVGENWIHHEDLRRAQGLAPRPLDPDLDDFLWRQLGFASRMAAFRLRGVALALEAPDGRRCTAGRAKVTVTLQGEPGELVLFLSGRRGAARVQLAGPADAIETVRSAKLGI